MDFLGIEITETATAWTAVAGILTSIGTTWKMFSTMRQNRELKNSEIKKSKFDILDIITERYKELLADFQIGQEFNSKIFEYQTEFCKKNLEDFIRFINDKKQKSENSGKTDF